MLSPETGLPLYRQLADRLRERVASGEFTPGARIPSEPELARRFGIARPTVRQATELLVREGLLERRRGAGTFVLDRPAAVDLLSLDGTLQAFAQAGGEVAFRVEGPIAPAPVDGLACAAVDASRPALALQRRGAIDETLVARETLWLTGHPLMPLAGTELADDASLSGEIAERLGIRPRAARQWVRAALVDEQLAPYEEQGAPLPALVIEREVDLDADDASVVSRLVCRADHIVLHPPDGGPSHVR